MIELQTSFITFGFFLDWRG